jgi:hypothetical protein
MTDRATDFAMGFIVGMWFIIAMAALLIKVYG